MKSNSNENAGSDLQLQKVIDFLAGNPNEHGLTADKVRGRAKRIQDPEWPGWVVFEMERHQPALGPIGRSSDEKAAWTSARRRYAYDPVKDELIEISVIGKPTLDCNIDGLAIAETGDLSFECTCGGNGLVICRESCTNQEAVVLSREEAIEFGRSIVEEWTFESLFFETHGLDLGEQLGRAIGELHNRCAELAGEAAAMAWDDLDCE